jgi:hypothetical protein
MSITELCDAFRHLLCYICTWLSAYANWFSFRFNLQVLTRATPLCSKLCYLKETYEIEFTVLTEKGGREWGKGLKGIKGREKWDEGWKHGRRFPVEFKLTFVSACFEFWSKLLLRWVQKNHWVNFLTYWVLYEEIMTWRIVLAHFVCSCMICYSVLILRHTDVKCHCHSDTNPHVVQEKRAVSFTTILIWNYYCDHFVFVATIIDSDPHDVSQITGRGSGHMGYYNPMQGSPRLSGRTPIYNTEYKDLKSKKCKIFIMFIQIVKILCKEWLEPAMYSIYSSW